MDGIECPPPPPQYCVDLIMLNSVRHHSNFEQTLKKKGEEEKIRRVMK